MPIGLVATDDENLAPGPNLLRSSAFARSVCSFGCVFAPKATMISDSIIPQIYNNFAKTAKRSYKNCLTTVLYSPSAVVSLFKLPGESGNTMVVTFCRKR